MTTREAAKMEGTAWVGAGVGVLEWMERRSVCTGVNWGTTEEGGGEDGRRD